MPISIDVVGDTSREIAGETRCWSCVTPRRRGDWCPRCLERYDRPREIEPEIGYAPRPAPVPRQYSRVRATPMSFGMLGRCSLSIVPLLVGFFSFRNLLRSRHDLTFSYYLVMGVPTLVLVAGFLAVVWRRERLS